jgi:hypothetical protein
MNGYKDVFNILIRAQRSRTDFRKEARALAKAIESLYEVATKEKIDKNYFEESRDKVVNNLFLKGKGIYKRANEADHFNPSELIKYLQSEEEFCKLADFYRGSYYAIFYLSRALYVKFSSFDTTEHKNFDTLLIEIKEVQEKTLVKLQRDNKAYEAKNGKTNTTLDQKISETSDIVDQIYELAACYDEIKSYREIADYKMEEGERIKLTNEVTFTSLVKAKVDSFFTFWDTKL